MLRQGVARLIVKSHCFHDFNKSLQSRIPPTLLTYPKICDICMYSTSHIGYSKLPRLSSWNTKISQRAFTSSASGNDENSPKAETTATKDQESKQVWDTIVKVQPTVKKAPKSKIDLSQSYTENIYITPLRAMTDYLLKPADLDGLVKFKRRSPFPEINDIRVYRRQDVENKAISKWGSLEKVAQEREKVKAKERKYSKYISKSFEALRGYEEFGSKTEEQPFIFSPSAAPKPKRTESLFKSGSGKVIIYAIAINGGNCLLKGIAWLYTGSHSMFAEFIHSVADTVNQIILAVGLYQSFKQPDTEHPYGWSNFRHVASLISGVGIFCLGSGISIYHGCLGIMHPTSIESLYWAIAVLGASFISEGSTLLIAINEIRRSAKLKNVSFADYVYRGTDPSTNVVLLEDAAAVLGVVIAGSCMSISYYLGNPLPDAAGCLMIGMLLGSVASFIIYTNTITLVGKSIPIEKKLELMRELENDRMIRALHDVKATEMGSASVKFKAEVDFDGKEITRLYLERQDLDEMLSDINKVGNTDELECFMLKHGENIVDTLGEEVDRIEKALKTKHPEVRHVDLEQL